MASRTTRSVSGLTKRVPFNTCETVDVETPATRATSAIVAMKFASPTSRNARGGVAPFPMPPSRDQTKRNFTRELEEWLPLERLPKHRGIVKSMPSPRNRQIDLSPRMEEVRAAHVDTE